MMIEIAMFKVKEGVTDERVVAVSDLLQEDLATVEGYLGRQLCKAADGQWADVVRWTDMEAGHRAMAAIERNGHMKDFMEIEEPGSTQMVFVTPVKEYEGSVQKTAV